MSLAFNKNSALTVEDVIALTVITFNALATQKDLSPNNPAVNEILSRFVRLVMQADHEIGAKDAVLSSQAVLSVRPQLTSILSRAEYEMEMYFSRLLCRESRLALNDLHRFWYRDNYESLVAQEIRGLKSCIGAQPEGTIAFVGAGPLPLSAIDYHLQTGQSCVCIEADPAAAEAGRILVEKLELADHVLYIQAPGDSVDYSPYEFIMVASLVIGKAGVLSRIRDTSPNAIVGIRSADGLKTLLYDPVDVEQVSTAGFNYYGCAQATDETVNSTCFFRVAQGAEIAA